MGVVGGSASEHGESATVRQGAITSPRQWPLFARASPGIHSSGQDYSTLTYKTSQRSFSSPCSPLSLFASFHLDLRLLNMGEYDEGTVILIREVSMILLRLRPIGQPGLGLVFSQILGRCREGSMQLPPVAGHSTTSSS